MILLSSFVFGLIFGSFLNVLIYRLRNGGRIFFDRSKCPHCKTTLKWHDLVPLLSFAYLYGRCRYCRKKISWQYPIVEILSGLIWVGVFYKNFNGNFQFLISNFQYLNLFYEIFILSALLVVAVYDARWKIIPDKIVYPAIIIVFIYNAFNANLIAPLFVALSVFLFFFLIYYFSSGRAMGLGDAKLSFLIGLFLNPISSLVAFNSAFISGAIYAIILLVIGKKSLESKIALGPFLVLGAITAFLLDFLINKIFIF
jgi:prepilin signal peptidase PulO-like enzyme (type II secretory pathway)